MKTNTLIKTFGSIEKKESLVPVEFNILNGTCVAEANEPYSDYYGKVPHPAIPNSLFLFTSQYYSLVDVLRFVQNIDSCYMEKVNVAAAYIDFGRYKYNAIRIKYFPDYERLHLLQSCFMKVGAEFISKVHMSESAAVKINKCFVLEEAEQGIFIDKNEENRGYIAIPKQIRGDEFLDKISKIKNNEECPLFDAARGVIIIDSKARDIARIYS
ncbi:MAG: hypothetical protein ACP5E3_08365, partial [Bacteroidales bacterium]